MRLVEYGNRGSLGWIFLTVASCVILVGMCIFGCRAIAVFDLEPIIRPVSRHQCPQHTQPVVWCWNAGAFGLGTSWWLAMQKNMLFDLLVVGKRAVVPNASPDVGVRYIREPETRCGPYSETPLLSSCYRLVLHRARSLQDKFIEDRDREQGS